MMYNYLVQQPTVRARMERACESAAAKEAKAVMAQSDDSRHSPLLVPTAV
jgi:hypothetical protein